MGGLAAFPRAPLLPCAILVFLRVPPRAVSAWRGGLGVVGRLSWGPSARLVMPRTCPCEGLSATGWHAVGGGGAQRHWFAAARYWRSLLPPTPADLQKPSARCTQTRLGRSRHRRRRQGGYHRPTRIGCEPRTNDGPARDRRMNPAPLRSTHSVYFYDRAINMEHRPYHEHIVRCAHCCPAASEGHQ